MFWIASASVKSATDIARSRLTGVTSSPILCRMPMPSASNSAVPIRMIRTWRALEAMDRDVSEKPIRAVMKARLSH